MPIKNHLVDVKAIRAAGGDAAVAQGTSEQAWLQASVDRWLQLQQSRLGAWPADMIDQLHHKAECLVDKALAKARRREPDVRRAAEAVQWLQSSLPELDRRMRIRRQEDLRELQANIAVLELWQGLGPSPARRWIVRHREYDVTGADANGRHVCKFAMRVKIEKPTSIELAYNNEIDVGWKNLPDWHTTTSVVEYYFDIRPIGSAAEEIIRDLDACKAKRPGEYIVVSNDGSIDADLQEAGIPTMRLGRP